MGIRIRLIGIMDIIGCHQGNIQFPAHLQQLRIYHTLFRISVVLQFQEEIPLPEAFLVLPGSLPGLVGLPFGNTALHFPCQAGRQGDDPLVITI